MYFFILNNEELEGLNDGFISKSENDVLRTKPYSSLSPYSELSMLM